jgi:hypothetical protein
MGVLLLTAAAFNAQKASCSSLMVNGMTYYQCGSSWYQPTYQGSNVTYVVVTPPQQGTTIIIK